MSEINNESGYYKALKIAGTVLLKIFLAPGRILLWNRYMYAKPGSIAISARQRKSLPHVIFFSFFFGVFSSILLRQMTRLRVGHKTRQTT